jgi:hypothetical protein
VLVLGSTPFLALALPARARLDVTRPLQGVACGVVCMALQLVAGVSGPILDAFFVQSGMDRRGIVATKATVQTLGHALKIAYFGALLALEGGELSPIVALGAVALAFTGTHVSRGVLERMTDRQFIRWSRTLIVVVAIAYLWQGGVMVARERREAAAARGAATPATPARDLVPARVSLPFYIVG